MKLIRSLASFSAAIALISMALISMAPFASAAPVPYPVVITDTSGNRVTGATFAVNGTTLTPGTAATVSGKLLATGATVSSASVTEYEQSNGMYTIVYDAAATGEAYFPLTVTKSGSTIAPVFDMVCSADSTNIASNGTTATAINTKLGTPAGASVSADILTANTGITSANTAIGNLPSAATIQAALTNVGLSTANAAKVAAFAAALNASTGAVTLPTTVPAGYGGSGSGGSPVVHR